MLTAEPGSHNATAPIIKRTLPVALLPSRLILFALFQLLVAVIVQMASGVFSYQAAGIYWPYTATAANVATFMILVAAFKREGLSVTSLYRFGKGTAGTDIVTALIVLVVAAPLSVLPNGILASVLFGDPSVPNQWLFGRMPVALTYLAVLMPLTIAFAELPLYMGYIMPRLSLRSGNRAAAILTITFFLALQHCALPLIFDVRFILLRFAAFLPLALLFTLVLNWRPRLMPYMMIVHAIMDFGAVGMIIYMSTQQ